MHLIYVFFGVFAGEQNHINGLESLKDELNIITKAKNELEKRLQTTVIEKETIFSSLEEALDRIHTLERHTRDQESKLKVNKSMKKFELSKLKRVRALGTSTPLRASMDHVDHQSPKFNTKIAKEDLELWSHKPYLWKMEL